MLPIIIFALLCCLLLYLGAKAYGEELCICRTCSGIVERKNTRTVYETRYLVYTMCNDCISARSSSASV